MKKKHRLLFMGAVLTLLMLMFSQHAFASTEKILLHESCENCRLTKIVEEDGELKFAIFTGREIKPGKVVDYTEVVAFNDDQSVKWHRTHQFLFSPYGYVTLSKDGTLYLGAVGSVVALDASGNEKWRFAIEKGAPTAPLEGPDGTLYFGEYNWTDYNGPYLEINIYAITKDGELKWKESVPGQASFELLNNSTLLVSAGPKLMNFEFNGELIWEYTDPVELESYSPFIRTIVIDDVIYGKSSGALFAFDFSGNEKWRKSVEGEGYAFARLTDGKKNILVYETADEKNKPILNWAKLDGKQVWSHQVDVREAENRTWYDVNIYAKEQDLFVEADNKLTKINIDGETEYTLELENYVSEFILADEVGYIFLTDFSNDIFEIISMDLNNGKILNRFTVSEWPSAPMSDNQNNLYFGSNHLLYKVNGDDLSNTDPEKEFTPWKKQFENVATDKTWTITFNQELNEETINGNTIYVSLLGEETKVPTAIQVSEDKKSVTITPNALYESGQTYQLKIKGVESLKGKKLSSPIVMTFTTKTETSHSGKTGILEGVLGGILGGVTGTVGTLLEEVTGKE